MNRTVKKGLEALYDATWYVMGILAPNQTKYMSWSISNEFEFAAQSNSSVIRGRELQLRLDGLIRLENAAKEVELSEDEESKSALVEKMLCYIQETRAALTPYMYSKWVFVASDNNHWWEGDTYAIVEKEKLKEMCDAVLSKLRDMGDDFFEPNEEGVYVQERTDEGILHDCFPQMERQLTSRELIE